MLFTCLWLLFETFLLVESQQCDPNGSLNDWRLVNHILQVLRDSTSANCFLECEKNIRCQSYNFRYDVSECELNKKTRDARPDDLIPFEYSFHMDRATRVPLGSIAEVPASNCQEISRTNSNAQHGQYWIDENDSGIARLQGCVFQAIQNCDGVIEAGVTTSGVYTLTLPDNQGPIQVFCKVNAAAKKGWIMIVKREDGSVDFQRNWASFKTGFGNLSGEYWLGLENIHRLTKDGPKTLRFELEDWGGVQAYAEYSAFSIDDEAEKYKLTVSGYTGNASDSFTFSSGVNFTTPDSDNDLKSEYNCAVKHSGSWWHKNCFGALLTGPYHNSTIGSLPTWGNGVIWKDFKGFDYSLKRAEMMFR